jgi:hypothetical protein
MKNKQCILAFTSMGALVGASTSAQGQDPKFAHGSGDELAELEKASEIEWKAGAQAGLILTTGNSRTTTVSAGAKASRKANKNKVAVEATTAYIRSGIYLANDADMDGDIGPGEFSRLQQTTAKAWDIKTRYDRFLSDKDALYLTGVAQANEPAGKKFVGGGQAGYSRTAYKDDKNELVAETGYDFSYEKPVVGDGFANHSLRVFLGYQGKLSEKTGLDTSVEGLFNINELDTPTGPAKRFEDARINGNLSFTTELFEDIAFRLGFTAKYDNVPSPFPSFDTPFEAGYVPPADELDTKTEATLIINFL